MDVFLIRFICKNILWSRRAGYNELKVIWLYFKKFVTIILLSNVLHYFEAELVLVLHSALNQGTMITQYSIEDKAAEKND